MLDASGSIRLHRKETKSTLKMKCRCRNSVAAKEKNKIRV